MGLARTRERFYQANLGLLNGGPGLGPQHYWPCFLGWGRVEESVKSQKSRDRVVSLNVAHIYGYDLKESGLVGPR